MNGNSRSAILRAEVLRGDCVEITCALEMTVESVFIVTSDLPQIGEVVSLRLSFPRMVRPFLTLARVRQVRLSTGPGSASGFVAEFELESEAQRHGVREVVHRVSAPSLTVAARRGLSVLLVEDNKLIRDMFVYAVDKYFGPRARKVDVVQAASVAAAWDEIDRRRDFDVVVVDHFLPDDTGASFVCGLRSNVALHRLPVVAMSVGGPEVRNAMVEAGADLFLQKPIVLKDLFYTFEFLVSMESGGARGAA